MKFEWSLIMNHCEKKRNGCFQMLSANGKGNI